MTNPVGRPKLGLPMSITLTTSQRLWLSYQSEQTGTSTSAILRLILDKEINSEEHAASRKRVAKKIREIAR